MNEKFLFLQVTRDGTLHKKISEPKNEISINL